MVQSRTLSLLLLGALLTAPAASAARLHLDVGPTVAPLTEEAAWQAEGDALVSATHPLSPRLAVGGLAVEIPERGTLRVTALRVGPLARGNEPALAPAQARPFQAELNGSWQGVDERYTLTDASLKHDLVLRREAVAALYGGPLSATWRLELPPNTAIALEEGAGAVLRDLDGRFLARFPLPVVADAADTHPRRDVASFELRTGAGSAELDLLVDAAWLHAPERAFPLLLDPTIDLQPLDGTRTGYVTDSGFRGNDAIVAGSLALIGLGSDVRGYAQFDTSAIPDDAVITGVHLHTWLANHDNPPDAAMPTVLDIRAIGIPIDSAVVDVWNEIGPVFSPDPYVNTAVLRTGDDFCAEAFEARDYDLGPAAIADLEAQLAADWFAIGFVADSSPDPLFQHIDFIGFTEDVSGAFGCAEMTVPGGRMTLVVDYETESVCTPRNHGYWHRYCLGQDAIDPGRRGHGNGPGPQRRHDDLPAGLLAAADAAMAPYSIGACEALDEGPFSDLRLAALRELSTLHLNVAAGLLKLSCPVELAPIDETEGLVVGDAIAMMEALLADGSDRALHDARWIGEHVANREALIRE